MNLFYLSLWMASQYFAQLGKILIVQTKLLFEFYLLFRFKQNYKVIFK